MRDILSERIEYRRRARQRDFIFYTGHLTFIALNLGYAVSQLVS
jgi:hypothetical protein